MAVWGSFTTNSKLRTDLALEAREIWQQSANNTTTLPGVRARSKNSDGFLLETVDILDETGARELGLPCGRYVTLSVETLLRREADAFSRAARVLASELGLLLGTCSPVRSKDGSSGRCEPSAVPRLPPSGCVLVVGLGNSAITPDSLGPLALDSTLITRHLRERLPQHFGSFRPVAGLKSGVLGTTGMESADLIGAVVSMLRPCAVIAVDAIAARSASRLCRTVQLSDAGIVPGSGVGNVRRELSFSTLGVPVISVGVPTVVSAETLALDLAGTSKLDSSRESELEGLFVTPRDIDSSVRDLARLIGYSVNLALHDGLTIEDIDMFLS